MLTLPIIYLLRKYVSPATTLVIVLLLTFYLTKITKTPYNLSLTTSVIAYGISYFIFLISTALLSAIGYSLFLFKGEYPPNQIIIMLICLTQIICTAILFKFRRLKNGMPTLKEHSFNDNGVYISILVLLAASFLSVRENENFIFIIPFFFTFLCGLTLFFWWKSSITKKYLDKIKAREIEELQKIIKDNNLQIEQLKQHNDELSRIIHKDNKLIPAMEYAVREYLSTTKLTPTNNTASAKGQELLEQLACLTKERAGILTNYETNNKKLVSTDIPSIDTLLNYMSRKARSHEISFDVSLSGSFVQLTKQAMEEADLRTLLADLIDNAIIATKKSHCRNILISLGLNGGWYSIDIFDSGELFKAETLSNIGSKRTTTHAKEGGSGIGLMTTFELIKKCQASFIIEELPDSQLFTKKVSVCFDQLGEFRIKTSREEIQKSLPFHSCTMQNSSQKYLYLLQQCSSVYTPVEH
jgi:signal transduction histidine kinase